MMNSAKILSFIAALAVMGAPQAAFAQPQSGLIMAQQPTAPSPAVNEPACYLITKNGNVTNLSALCGFQPKDSDRPANLLNSTNDGNAGNSPRAQTQVAPTRLGQVPIPRLNVRNNRDTRLQDYR